MSADRTAVQNALLTSPAAWAWYMRGYEAGVQSGHQIGYREAMKVLDEAAAFLATIVNPDAPDVDTLRVRRNSYTAPALTAQQISARSATSWVEVAR